MAIDEDDVAHSRNLEAGSTVELFTEHLDDPAIRKSALDEARRQGLVEDKRSKKRKPLRPAPSEMAHCGGLCRLTLFVQGER